MEEDSTTNRIALLWLELINQSFVGYTDLYVNLWTFYSNILFIRPKKRANIFPTNIFPPPALKYPSSFHLFWRKERDFDFSLPRDRPKPGIRRRYSVYFSYWRDTRGWTPGSHFQLHRLPRLIRIQRALCKFRVAGRTERSYRPLRPRSLAWKGSSLHSGSLPSAKHNRSVSHCQFTQQQFISSYTYMFP